MTLTDHIRVCTEAAHHHESRVIMYLSTGDGVGAALHERHAEHFRSEAKRLATQRPVEPEVED